jgi:hypothetical protein
MQHWNLQVTTFMAGEPWSLWVSDEDDGHTGRAWARGFELAASSTSGWKPLIEGHADLLGSVLWLANDGPPDRRRRRQPITGEERESMLQAISHGLPRLYAATRPGAERPRKRRPVKKARRPRKRGKP